MIFGEESSEPKSQGPQVRLDMSQLETIYANAFALAGSADEIVLYVGANLPMPNMKEPLVRVSHRVAFVPVNAKRLMIALQQTIKAHEERFGPIELPAARRHPPQQ